MRLADLPKPFARPPQLFLLRSVLSRLFGTAVEEYRRHPVRRLKPRRIAEDATHGFAVFPRLPRRVQRYDATASQRPREIGDPSGYRVAVARLQAPRPFGKRIFLPFFQPPEK